MSKRYFNPKKRTAFFDQVLMETPSTNTFDLSHSNKLSFNMGELIPILAQEVVPGDKMNIKVEHLIKAAPMVFPVMHRVKVQTHYFFVPNRLLWDGFEDFQAYDTLNDIPEHPYISLMDINKPSSIRMVEINSLADYLGVPTGDYSTHAANANHPMNKLNALVFASYFKIFDDYYRDQNLVPEKWRPLEDGNASDNPMFAGDDGSENRVFLEGSILRRAWEKDYFTSALPFAQKGQEVVLPLGTTADIFYEPDPDGEGTMIRELDGSPHVGNHGLVEDDGVAKVDDRPSPGQQQAADFDNSNVLKVNLESATAASINDFRIAYRLQEFFERNARLGTRYIEQMLGKFGVRISDARAHRAEYIGGTTAPLVFGEVLQTSETETTPLGQQGGYGNSINSDHAANYFCEEHGWIIGIASILPETNYMQGLHRKFIKEDILDYYDPMFANLGEQAVYNFEIYANESVGDVRDTFGYQSRYAEMKYNLSEVHGAFRTELRPWHMARYFGALPRLNDLFVTAYPTHDIFADTDPETQKMYAYFHHTIIARRKIPFFSTPNLQGFGT